jgi:heptosyltransferase-2
MPGDPDNILVWLPSPLGDAVMSTPALQALRQAYPRARITWLANPVVRAVLSPSRFGDAWLTPEKKGSLALARRLRRERFDQVILCKNSLGSAWVCWLAGIPVRTGYRREGRGWLLTERLQAPRQANGAFLPAPMIDYYLALIPGGPSAAPDRQMTLSVDPAAAARLRKRYPDLIEGDEPVVVLVPGGGFGPSKCWAPERFARVAERLHAERNARTVLSVAPNPTEQAVAAAIVEHCRAPLINLAQQPLDLGELKALLARTDLVITNDTGPRHMAIALQRPVVTLFGPNDPAWTQTGWVHEIQIVGRAPCVPCQQPICRAERHLCMESITVCEVLDAVARLLDRRG